MPIKSRYTGGRYPPGSNVRVKGMKHALEGKVGIVVRQDPFKKSLYHIRFGTVVYVVEGNHLGFASKRECNG